LAIDSIGKPFYWQSLIAPPADNDRLRAQIKN
jgi:hypothetical protein